MDNGEVAFGFGVDLLITGAQDITSLSGLCADILTATTVGVLPKLSVGIQMRGGKVRYSDGISETFGTGTLEENGGVTGEACPANVALVTGGSDGTSYRGGKGRTYWGLIPMDALASSLAWDSGYLGDFESAWAALVTAIDALTPNGGTCTAGVVHRVVNKLPITPAFGPYISTHAQRRVCSQRRRLGKLL